MAVSLPPAAIQCGRAKTHPAKVSPTPATTQTQPALDDDRLSCASSCPLSRLSERQNAERSQPREARTQGQPACRVAFVVRALAAGSSGLMRQAGSSTLQRLARRPLPPGWRMPAPGGLRAGSWKREPVQPAQRRQISGLEGCTNGREVVVLQQVDRLRAVQVGSTFISRTMLNVTSSSAAIAAGHPPAPITVVIICARRRAASSWRRAKARLDRSAMPVPPCVCCFACAGPARCRHLGLRRFWSPPCSRGWRRESRAE